MDSVIDMLLFGLYPRGADIPERMAIDRKKAESIFEGLQI